MRGRPTKYSAKVVEQTARYLQHYASYGDVVPSVVGLCSVLGVSRSTLYRWASEEGKEDFRDMLEAINEAQERAALNGGLSNDMNATIVKLILAKHGYSDKSQLEHSGLDGGPIEYADLSDEQLDARIAGLLAIYGDAAT